MRHWRSFCSGFTVNIPVNIPICCKKPKHLLQVGVLLRFFQSTAQSTSRFVVKNQRHLLQVCVLFGLLQSTSVNISQHPVNIPVNITVNIPRNSIKRGGNAHFDVPGALKRYFIPLNYINQVAVNMGALVDTLLSDVSRRRESPPARSAARDLLGVRQLSCKETHVKWVPSRQKKTLICFSAYEFIAPPAPPTFNVVVRNQRLLSFRKKRSFSFAPRLQHTANIEFGGSGGRHRPKGRSKDERFFLTGREGFRV